jgi:hypothetical protein
MRTELAGPTPTPLEKLLVERIVTCWLQLQDADIRCARAKDLNINQADYHQRRIDHSHKRFLSGIKTLACVGSPCRFSSGKSISPGSRLIIPSGRSRMGRPLVKVSLPRPQERKSHHPKRLTKLHGLPVRPRPKPTAKRHLAGPLDYAIYKVKSIAKKFGWYITTGKRDKPTYQARPNISTDCSNALPKWTPSERNCWQRCMPRGTTYCSRWSSNSATRLGSERHRKLETLVKYDDNRQDLAGEMAATLAADI